MNNKNKRLKELKGSNDGWVVEQNGGGKLQVHI
jgi:hypothetical protein